MRTSQVRQTFLASRVEPPFSGKNASGSVWAHSARSCHPSYSDSWSDSLNGASMMNSSCTVILPSTRRPPRVPS